jgi:hypothetical protein
MLIQALNYLTDKDKKVTIIMVHEIQARKSAYVEEIV